METKLRRNDHKTGWQTMSVDALMVRASQELLEMSNAITDDMTERRVRLEAADVANFLMMAVDNYGRLP